MDKDPFSKLLNDGEVRGMHTDPHPKQREEPLVVPISSHKPAGSGKSDGDILFTRSKPFTPEEMSDLNPPNIIRYLRIGSGVALVAAGFVLGGPYTLVMVGFGVFLVFAGVLKFSRER